jgi:hypothetical protein
MYAKRFYYKFINIYLLFQNKILILLRDTDTQLVKKKVLKYRNVSRYKLQFI